MSAQIHTEIDIDASADIVWGLLTDLDGYQDWNPFVVRASGKIALHETLYCEPRMPGSRRTMRFRPTVTRCEPGVEFAWTGIVLHPAFSAGEHIFRLEPLGAERVRLIHDEVFSGLSAPLVARFGGEKTRRGFVLMNEALKRRAEQQARSS